MKSVSLKALALASIIVAGSAQAGFTDTVKGYANTAKDFVVDNAKSADRKLFGKLKIQVNQQLVTDTFGEEIGCTVKGGYRPFSTVHPYIRNGYVRAAAVVAAGAAVVAGLYKTIKHFTKPAADATEGENTEANDETVA